MHFKSSLVACSQKNSVKMQITMMTSVQTLTITGLSLKKNKKKQRRYGLKYFRGADESDCWLALF